jgi:hypothetical protein
MALAQNRRVEFHLNYAIAEGPEAEGENKESSEP